MTDQLAHTVVDTPIGTLTLVASPHALREVRFDLTSPRAFGRYDLVIEQPGQPNQVVPVTVRPFRWKSTRMGGDTSSQSNDSLGVYWKCPLICPEATSTAIVEEV